MPVGKTCLKIFSFTTTRAGYSCGLAVLLFLLGSKSLQNAVAEGDTRTISMHHIHTDEDITITYKRDGRYDEAALEKLNWFLRDWRRGEATHMDPHLIDLVWEVQREIGTKEPIWVVCGYRSPQTNAMLRHRSRGVARFSQHMLGRAMDFYIPGVPLSELRVIGLRLQRGGVGFYPTSGSPFVHMDTGNIRMWPRMTREELSRVFPDGRTVLIPSDGRPLSGYALALSDIRKRGSDPSTNSLEAARDAGVNVGDVVASNEPRQRSLFAKLLGLTKDDDEEDADSAKQAPASMTLSKPATLASLEHKAAKTAAAAAKVAKAAQAKIVHTASLVHVNRTPAQNPAPAEPTTDATRFASLTPNQIIATRGYWRGSSDTAKMALPVAQTASLLRAASVAHHNMELASAAPDATGSISPWSKPSEDRVPPELALAYAEQPGHQESDVATPVEASTHRTVTASASLPVPQTPDRPTAAPTPGIAAASMSLPMPPVETTIAVKRAANQAASRILTASAKLASIVKARMEFDNPWLRAMVVSPSVSHFLTAMAIGERDYRALASLMAKPARSVMMTFSADPNPGLTQDHFSGSAVVFVSTVSYLTHTASIQ